MTTKSLFWTITLASLTLCSAVKAQNVTGSWKSVITSPGGSAYLHSDVTVRLGRNGVWQGRTTLRKTNNPGLNPDIGKLKQFTLVRKRGNVFTYRQTGFSPDPLYGGRFVTTGDLTLQGNKLSGHLLVKTEKVPNGVKCPTTFTRTSITTQDCVPPRRGSARSSSRSTRSRSVRGRSSTVRPVSRSSSRLRTFTKARLRVRNNTNQTVSLRVNYRTNVNASRTWGWARRSYTLRPGQSILTRSASRVQLSGSGSGGGRWNFDQWLVKRNSNGRRNYRASRVGIHTVNLR